MAGYVTLLRAKAVTSGGERWIEGYATTPDLDRVGDVVVPKGARFSLPLPLLWAHKHDEPIGAVTEARITESGIRIRARLSIGVQRAEEVWQLIKDGALTAVSIGFLALKKSPLAAGGYRFDEWDWTELSVVSVPALPGAKISVAKGMAFQASDIEPTPVTVAKAGRFGYVKGMTATGVDLERVFTDNAARAKEVYREDANKKANLAHLGYGVAMFAKANASTALAMIKDLEERITRIESKGVVYRGHFNLSEEYTRGDLVTHGGSIFHATRDTAGLSPAHGEERKELDHPWQLDVRRGRDAKEGLNNSLFCATIAQPVRMTTDAADVR